MIDTRVGPYTITAELGAGGMGEVWRATDTKLGRDVAIKVLPADFADDPERHARFEREARVLASLNHPNIATLYGLEHLDDRHVLVMELVEGEGLDERIARGPIPVDEATPIAVQIAEALEAAHEAGIVHRDLKPANIRIRRDGAVKVLDFGLAKAWESEVTDGGLTHSPTLTQHHTKAGVILGTAAYMAPEQAKGSAIDKRADIWAFGVVVYEMLVGRQLFGGDSVPETLAGVLKSEIDLDSLPGGTPPAIRTLLRRCLERNPKNRVHDIADARIVIGEVLTGTDRAEAAPPIAPAPTRRAAAPWIAAIGAAAAVGVLLGHLTGGRTVAPREAQRLAIELPPSQELVVGGNAILVFSPDGRSLVYSGSEGGHGMLYRRDLGDRAPVRVPGTEDGQAAFFSPDGAWLGFVSNGNLMKVPAEGGRPFRLADARGAGGATWLADGTIVFAPLYSDGLFRMSAEGGPAQRLTTPDRSAGVLGHWWPQPLPDGRRVLFTAFRTPVDDSRIGVVDLESLEVRWVVEGGFYGRYLPTGHLLYARGPRLYAVAFDPDRAAPAGPAKAVLDDLVVDQTGGNALVAVSSDGMLAYVTESLGRPARELVWIDRSGRASPATRDRRAFLSASLSPDDSQAALTIQGASRDLWIYSFGRGVLSRLTTGENTEFDPIWSRSGEELFYVVDSPPFVLHRITVGASDSGTPVWPGREEFLDSTNPAVSPDGRTLVFTLTEEQTGTNLYTRPLDGSAPASPFRATRSQESDASFSPDGRWIVYEADDTGRNEIYVEAFPGPGQRFQISADGGDQPVWARNGEIFYRRGDEMWVVATRGAERLELEPPRLLFSFPIVPGVGSAASTYDVSRDGQRVLAVTVPDGTRPRQIEVVTDWTAELERLVPGAVR